MSKKNFFKDNAKIFDAGVKYAGEGSGEKHLFKNHDYNLKPKGSSPIRRPGLLPGQHSPDVWRYPVLAPVSQAFCNR